MSYTQRETPILAELCTFLVEDVYGELAARVFSILARYGRQQLREILRLSYLNRRQIRFGLVILLQQHLIFHSPSEASAMFYEINWQQSYTLVRCGKVAKLVEDRFGKKAATVMSNLLHLGHTQITDLKNAFFPLDPESDAESDDGIVNGMGLNRPRTNGAQVNGTKGKVNGTVNHVSAELDDTEDVKSSAASLTNGDGTSNGVSKTTKVNGTSKGAIKDDAKERGEEHDEGNVESPEELYDIIQLLMQQGWVMKVEEEQYLSAGDYHNLATQEALDKEGWGAVMPTGPKDKAKVNDTAIRAKRRIRDTWLDVPQFSSRKRKAGDLDYGPSHKRVKMNGGHAYSNGGGTVGGSSSPEDELVIRVNPEKVAVAMRTQQLVHLVEQRLGFITAHIYRIMLQILESNLPRCFEEWVDPSKPGTENDSQDGIDPHLLVTAHDVAKQTRNIDICEGLDPHAIVQITNRGHVTDKQGLSQPVDPSKLTHDERTRIVDKHIQLLSEDPFHFVTWHSRAGFSQWHVEFKEIAKMLIQHELENTILARKGNLGVKLIRALQKKGKLDERQTCNVMMQSANHLRGIVNDLTVQGFVQTQEIPKVERREAKHSIHLIWYDRQRAREKLLHDTYKGMVRILQRIAFEREKVQPLLSKAERSDVVGNEAKYLSKSELDALKKWKEVQEKLLLQLFREDDLVATLRDFVGPLISV